MLREETLTSAVALSSERRWIARWRELPPPVLVGGTIVVVVVIVALAGSTLAPYPYSQLHVDKRLQPPSSQFLFGTDQFGRDVLSRVIVGARISLAYGIGCAVISLALGVPLGLCSGYLGGRFDEITMRALDLVMSIPPLMIGMLILAVTPPSLFKTIIAIGIITTPSAARIARSATLGLQQEEFVDAARAAGESTWWIIGSEILPNVIPLIIVEASLRVTFGILLGAALSFLGLGAQPPSSDWGLMLNDAREYIEQAPWISLYPGLAMCLTVTGFNLLGAGLRDLLDPQLR